MTTERVSNSRDPFLCAARVLIRFTIVRSEGQLSGNLKAPGSPNKTELLINLDMKVLGYYH